MVLRAATLVLTGAWLVLAVMDLLLPAVRKNCTQSLHFQGSVDALCLKQAGWQGMAHGQAG